VRETDLLSFFGCFSFFSLPVLGIELRALHMLGKSSELFL
jgi:hypothetical protein